MFYRNMWREVICSCIHAAFLLHPCIFITLHNIITCVILYNNIMYSLVSVPYYDHHTQCYKKVIKLNKMPPADSPLNQIIKNVGPIKLSPFQSDSTLMCIDELPSLFQFLVTNGFTIDTSITKMMQNSNVKLSNDLICFFS